MSLKISIIALLTIMVTLATAKLHPPKGRIMPCKDGQCEQCINQTFTLDAYPKARVHPYNILGTGSKQGSGWDVFWNVPQPDDGCKVLILTPYTQQKSTRGSGNVVLHAEHAGCWYTHLGSRGFMAQYCCGHGDCEHANGNLAKRDIEEPYADIALGKSKIGKRDLSGKEQDALEKWKRDDEARAEAGYSRLQESQSLYSRSTVYHPPPKKRSSVLGKRKEEFAADNFKATQVEKRNSPASWGTGGKGPTTPTEAPKTNVTCGDPKPASDPYSKASVQTPVSPTLVCNGEVDCSQNIMKTISVGKSLMSEKSVTLTNSAGWSASVTAGWNILFIADATISGNQEFSKALTGSFAETDMTDESTTVSQIVNQVPGTNAIATFTPTLKCVTFKVKCNDKDMYMEKCDPWHTGANSVAGVLLLMTVG